MDKKNKIKLIAAGAVEVAIVIFCLTISIWVLATWPKNANNMTETQFAAAIANNPPFIRWFQENNLRILLVLILPLLLILALDIVYLVIFATKKESALSQQEQAAIEERAKREAREELLREIAEEDAAEGNE